MSGYTDRERDLAAQLYAEFSGYDLANRLPLRCQGPWMQRQWCAVARLATALVGDDNPAPNVADLERLQVVRAAFSVSPLSNFPTRRPYYFDADGIERKLPKDAMWIDENDCIQLAPGDDEPVGAVSHKPPLDIPAPPIRDGGG